MIKEKKKYLKSLNKYIKENFILENIEKIEFLPYHKLGREKYIKINIPYPCEDIKEMDIEESKNLYNKFLEIFKNNEC